MDGYSLKIVVYLNKEKEEGEGCVGNGANEIIPRLIHIDILPCPSRAASSVVRSLLFPAKASPKWLYIGILE